MTKGFFSRGLIHAFGWALSLVELIAGQVIPHEAAGTRPKASVSRPTDARLAACRAELRCQRRQRGTLRRGGYLVHRKRC